MSAALDERVEFEPVTDAHADRLMALFERNAVPEVTAGFDPFPLTAATARSIACEPRRDGYYVAQVDDGTLIGLSMLRGADEGYEVPSFGIFIDRAHQGRGMGRKLTAWTIELARNEGAPAVRLSVYAENQAAIELYSSLGFLERERQRTEGANGREKIVMRLDFCG